MINKIKSTKGRLIFFMISMFAIKLLLVNSQYLYAITNAVHDDQLMYSYATSMLNGEWLGEYDYFTLIKGVIFPLWLGITNVLGIPLLIANQILYFVAIVIFIKVLSYIIKDTRWLAFIYTIILFNPSNFSVPDMQRLYRDGIYPAMTIMIISAIVAAFLNYKNKPKVMFKWLLFGGLVLTAFWLTREEGIWIVPFVFTALLATGLFIYFDKSCRYRRLKIIMLFIPIICLVSGNLIVATINKVYYGEFIVNEYSSKNFQRAYGALTRVKHEEWKMDIPVPKEVRERIYEVSPAFKELEPYLEGAIGKAWSKGGEDDTKDEIAASLFFWALRDAVDLAGYNENPTMANEYYGRLADEINQACDDGKLDAIGERSTLVSPMKVEYIKPVTAAFFNIMKSVVTFEDINVQPVASIGYTADIHKFEALSNTKAYYDNKVLKISGWVFGTKEDIKLEIVDSNNKVILSDIDIYKSLDVYNTFLERDYEYAKNARFEIEFKIDEGEEYYYVLKDDKGVVDKIKIDEVTAPVTTEDYYLGIDKKEYSDFNSMTKAEKIKNTILEQIVFIYQIISPILFIAALISYIGFVIKFVINAVKTKKFIMYKEMLILSGIFLTFILRTGIIAYLYVSSWTGVKTIMYLSTIYPLILMFTGLSLYVGYKLFSDKYKSRH